MCSPGWATVAKRSTEAREAEERRSGGAEPEIRGPDGAPPLPIDTKGAPNLRSVRLSLGKRQARGLRLEERSPLPAYASERRLLLFATRSK